MQAMILAAGRGERMRPLTDHLPKPLLSVNDKPLIEYHLEKFKLMQIKQVVINHAWLGHLIPKTLGNGSKWALNLCYSDEGNNALETAGGVKKAFSLLNDEYMVVVNGDIWTDFDLSTLPTSLPKNVLAHLILVNNPQHNLNGDFAIDDHYLHNDGVDRFTFSGIAVYHRDFFNDLDEGAQALGPLIREQLKAQKVTGELYQGKWFDIGTPQRLIQLDKMLREKS